MKIYISHSSSYDYENELYKPLKAALVDHDVFYPHDPGNTGQPAKEILPTCDILIAETSFPSTGQGIELGYADLNNVPVACFYKDGSNISSSIKFVTDKIIPYESTEQLIEKIQNLLEG